MKTIIAQLFQLPPTSSTIYGVAILVFVVSFMLTGNWEVAGVVAGLLKIVCPQDAPAIDRALTVAEREISTSPKA